jgi:hypothetical protein
MKFKSNAIDVSNTVNVHEENSDIFLEIYKLVFETIFGIVNI